MKMNFKKIYKLIEKKYLLIIIQFLDFFNVINITGKGFIIYFILMFIYVEKLLVKMKLEIKENICQMIF